MQLVYILCDYKMMPSLILSLYISLQNERIQLVLTAPCLENPLIYDTACTDVEKHPDPLVQPSLIKVCAFFYYRQVHLQTTIHHTSALSLQACNELSKSDL